MPKWKDAMKSLDNLLPALALTAATLVTALPAHAFDLNSDEPINVKADHARLDDNKGIATYTGDVIVTQADTRLDADKVVLYRNAEGLTRMEAEGKPAHYRQPAENGQGEVDAKALTITWSAKDKLLILERQAVITQNGNVFKGDVVHYDTANRVVTGQGNPNSTSGDGGRVEMVIQPRSTKQESNGSSQGQ